MYARVAKWEGAQGDALRRAAEEVSSGPAEPPPGIPAKGYLMLIDPDSGRSMGIVLFETEDDMRKGDETLRGMNPSSPDVGERTSVEFYEVGAEIRL